MGFLPREVSAGTWRRPAARQLAKGLVAASLFYWAFAYLAAPEYWWIEDHRVPVSPEEMITTTVDGIPGDPINVGFVGSREALIHAFSAAGWYPADAITLRSSIEIGESVIFDRPYADAPVSTLEFEGRRQDLSFEKSAGDSADRRHHVRLWRASGTDDGEVLWLGAASFDRGVGFSHDTGQITHHIDPNVDAERSYLIKTLEDAGRLSSTYEVEGIGPSTTRRNGGGDPYFTDGQVMIGLLGS